MATGTGLGQVVPILAVPLLTRLYTPGDYGLMTLYMTIAGMISVAANGMYSHAIVLAENDEQAINSFALCWLLTLGLSLLVLLVVMGSHSMLRTLTNFKDVGHWLYLVPLSVLLNGGYQNLYYWANRHRQYRELAGSRFAQALVGTGSQLVLGIMHVGAGGLVAGVIAGQTAGIALLIYRSLGRIWPLLSQLDFRKIGQQAARHKRFPLYMLPTEFVNVAINRIPVLFLSTFASLASVGYYGFALRILGLPMSMLSSSISDVFRERANSDFVRLGNCREIYLKTFTSLVLIAVAPFTIVFLGAPDLFEFVFGSQWREAGEFARWLSIMYFFGFVSSPLSYVYFIAGKQREDFILHLVMLMSILASMFLGYVLFGSPTYIICFFSLSYSLIYILYLVRSYTFAKGSIEIYVEEPAASAV